MPTAELADRTVSYVRRGGGEPLLLIMGMAGHAGMWGEPFLRELERDFEVLAFDHRGIGLSGRAERAFTIAELAGDAARLLGAVGWSDAHVLGISMGGMVAQELAIGHPEVVRTLTLGCTYAGPQGGRLAGVATRRLMEASASGDAEVVLRASYELNVSAGFRADPVAWETFRETSLAAKVPLPVVMMQAQAVRGHDAVRRLAGVRAPTMVVHGTADELIPASNAEHIAGLVPGARLELMDGVGHLFWWEQPQRTARLLREHALGSPRRAVQHDVTSR